MGAGSIFGIGVSGLNAAQAALATTSHNIANASSEGFHRQTAIAGTQTPQETGAGFFGKGVTVETVLRSYSRFLDGALLQTQTQASYLDAYAAQINQIDNLLADPSAGLSPALQSFFSAVQDVASNPSSVPSRQSMISQAQALISRFDSFDARLGEMRTGLNRQITDTVSAINSSADQLGRINDQIIRSQSTDLKPANDLLDKRDLIIADLNKLVRTSTVTNSDGSLNVFIGNGQSLVLGTQSYKLSAAPSAANPADFSISYLAGGNVIPISPNTLQGGALGALLAFRSETLDSVQNNLGRVAIVLAQTFNDQHRLGQDLNGAAGQDFFNVPAAQVVTNANNTAGGAVIAASNVTVGALTGSDYRLSFNAGTWALTRLTDGNQTTFAGFPQTIDGFTLSLTSGAAVSGDSFLIQPTRNGSRDIGVAITDTARVAAAAPIRSARAAANTGNATITPGVVNTPPPPNANLQQPVTFTFASATTFNVTGVGTGNPAGVAYVQGGNITYNGWTVQIRGNPAPGDSFTMGPNTGGVADNRNALLLAGLQTVNTVAGTANYQSAYSLVVSAVGNRAREIQVQSTAQDALVKQTTDAQQALSGVNLDEEAANLLRFQQAYQASGKVLSIASTLFDTILALG